MNRRMQINMALLVLVGALAAVVYFRPGQHPKSKAKAHLTNLKPKAIKTIRVQRAGQPTVKLVRHGQRWRVSEPFKARADEGLIGSALSAADETVSASYKAASLKLAKFGLAKPKLKVWLNGTEIDFGDTNPLGGKRYVHVGAHVFVVDDSLYDQLSIPVNDFISRRLLPEGATITHIEAPGLTVSRGQKGQWQAKPAPKNLAKGAVQDLVDSWTNAYAMSAARAEKGSSGPVAGTVQIRLKGRKEPVTFRILGGTKRFVLEREDDGLVYKLSGDRRQDLLKLKTQSPGKGAATSSHSKTGAGSQSGSTPSNPSHPALKPAPK